MAFTHCYADIHLIIAYNLPKVSKAFAFEIYMMIIHSDVQRKAVCF